jgi:hypothetical protein
MDRRSLITTTAKFSVYLSFTLSLLLMSGCAMNFAHHMAMKDLRGISDYYAGLTPVAPGYGRVIIYWQKRPMMPAMGSFQIQGDAGHMTLGYASQTGTIIDLPVGNYSLTSGGKLNKSEVFFSVHDGAIACYNTETVYDFMFGTMSGVMAPLQMQECLSNLTEHDIRCNLRSCQVLTVMPSTERPFAPYSTTDSHTQMEQLSKDFNTPQDRSRIYITRRRYTLGMVHSGVDGKPASTMESSSYACYDVEPGFHVITVDDPTGEKGFVVNTKGGENYFFHTDTLDFMSTAEGRARVTESDLLKHGFYRSAM